VTKVRKWTTPDPDTNPNPNTDADSNPKFDPTQCWVVTNYM